MKVPCRRCGVRINIWHTVTQRGCRCPCCGHSLLANLQKTWVRQSHSDVIDEDLFDLPPTIPIHEVSRRVQPIRRENIIDPQMFDR